ncbi:MULTISPECIES: hypothetical protein [unclassified Bradyrhizobium]|uniref:hypothetical protein n=1 Tax=unclassified Bradyrhizobium TaxID=2631580 RepID=UPI002916BFBB|nr:MULTISPECIES: hypothetical protein [unclassified Bradyrhizobium]
MTMRVETPIEKERRVARELRELMERVWNAPGVKNAKRLNRFAMPMRLGGTHGYEDDICAE